MDIDIRIMGVPERMENIRMTQEALSVPDDHIFLDTDHAGCIPNAKRAWGMPTDKKYVLVLQDDILLCKDFLSYAERIVRAVPNAILSLYPPAQVCRRCNIGRYPTDSPYVITKELTAQGIIMPSDMIRPCLDSWADERRGDDTNILFWAKQNDVMIVTVLPSLIQHIGFESVFDPGHIVYGTDFFDPDPVDANWDNPKLHIWTNVVRR